MTGNLSTAGTSRTVAGRLPALLVLTSSVAAAFACQLAFSPVQEAAKADLSLSDFDLSLVQGLAVSIPIALLALPLGRLTDRVHRLRLLFAMALTWTLGTLLTAFARDFWVLFVARMLAGAGMMCALPVAISLAADLSEPDQRGRAMLLLTLGRIVGTAAAFALGGALLGVYASEAVANTEPWRRVMMAFAVGSGLLMLPLFLLREPARRELGESAGAPFGVALRAIWQRRALLAPLFLGQVTVTMADSAAAIWAAPVLIRDYAQAPQDSAGWMGAVLLVSGLVGAAIGGIGADLAQKGRVRGGILASAALAAVVSVPTALYPLMDSVAGFAWMFAVFLTCGSVTGIVTATAIAVRVPNDIRGMCLGAFVVIAAIVGFGLAPTLVTLISSLLGGEAQLRFGLAVVGAVTSLISAIGFIAALRADRRAAA